MERSHFDFQAFAKLRGKERQKCGQLGHAGQSDFISGRAFSAAEPEGLDRIVKLPKTRFFIVAAKGHVLMIMRPFYLGIS